MSTAPVTNGRFVLPGSLEAQLATCSAALATVFPHGTTLHLDGEEYSIAKAVEELDAAAAVLKALREAHIAVAVAAGKAKDLRPETRQILRAIRDNAKLQFGPKAEELSTLGFGPKRDPRPLTVEERKASVDKARATRLGEEHGAAPGAGNGASA